MASSTAPRRGSDVLLTTLDHPGAGVARDGGGEQREYEYHVFQESCAATICKEPERGSLHILYCILYIYCLRNPYRLCIQYV